MSDHVPSALLEGVLEPGEHLRWQGRIGFTFGTSPIIALAIWMLTAYVVWSIWGSYSLHEYCPPADHVRKCGSYYIIFPACFLVMCPVIGFDLLERRALESGKAFGAVLLTDRRIIRVSEWPWHRVRAYNYHVNPPRRSYGNILSFGTYGSVFLAREDVDHVFRLMSNTGVAAQ